MSATLFHRLGAIVILLWLTVGLAACSTLQGGDNRHNQPLSGPVVQGLRNLGSDPGQGMVVRIFKEESVLEVWKQTSTGVYKLFRSYEICAFSGELGPKFMEGDRQSPEGFYTITPGLMNPRSSYYLAFNTGFPNKFDRVHGRTGSDLMVHGDCSSRGCYAMTDEGIAEIYALARESFRGGNASFQLQIFPFRMTAANLARHSSSPHLDFWRDIKEGYDLFELTRTPPVWDVCERQYIFNPAATGPLDPAGVCPPSVPNAQLAQLQHADNAAFADQAAATQAAADRLAAQEAALAERSEAVNGFFAGIGGMFGGQPAQPVSAVAAPMAQPAAMPTPVAERP